MTGPLSHIRVRDLGRLLADDKARMGTSHRNVQPQDVYACRDGDMVLAVSNDNQFIKFCAALSLPEWSADERFTRNASRVRNLDILRPLIASRLLQQDRAHWVAKLDAAGVPAAAGRA